MTIETSHKNKGITINGRFFEHVKTREHTSVRVFKGQSLFLRVGPRELLQPEIDFHKNLLQYRFPVPMITEEGEVDGQMYYTETSVGDQLMGELFWEDTKNDDRVSKTHFDEFLEMTIQFAQAQLKSMTSDRNEEGFYIGVHADILQEELPDFKTEILSAFEKAKKNTQKLPYVLTHGDLNPYNIFNKGIIDFGSAFHAPAGYDLVSNTHHTYFFPKTGEYESMRRYQFTTEQLEQYYTILDDLYQSTGLPNLSDYREDFILLRSIWATVRMNRYPKVQQYRYTKFKELVAQYLSSESISCLEI